VSLVEEVLGRDCTFCSGPADEVDELAATFDRCPGCARSLRDDPEPEEPARAVLRASADWPGFPQKRGNPRDPEPVCGYAACRKAPRFLVYLALRAEHGGERRVPLCVDHAEFLTLNDSFAPGASFAGQDLADRGPWSDFEPAPEAAEAEVPA
jgi:hypothetical protein